MEEGLLAGVIIAVAALILAAISARRPAYPALPSGRDETRDHEYLMQLRDQLQKVQAQNEILLKQVGEYRISDRNLPPLKPLLVICQNNIDNPITAKDLAALQRVRDPNGCPLKFQRLLSATKQDVIDELRRRRQERNAYWWIHISSHGDAEGIHLADGKADGQFWLENLHGIKGVFLNSCSNVRVADQFTGLVDFVVVVYEPILNQDAADFTHAFWENMLATNDPNQAYARAIEEVPQVASYTDIRRS